MTQELTAEQRRGALRTYLDDLARRLTGRKITGDVSVGGPQDLTLDQWEARAVRVAVVSSDASVPAISTLMAEAVALRLMLANDCQVLEVSGVKRADPGSPLYETLSFDVAIGRQQLHDLQQEINLLVRDQRFGEAKRLNQFRTAVREDVKKVAGFLLPPDPTAPDSDQPLQLDTAIYSLDELDAPRRRRRTVILLSTVMVLAALWVAAIVVPARGKVRLKSLTIEDFAEIEEILEVEARPPSLYVTIDGVGWQALDEAERLRLLRDLGKVMVDHQYTGAHVRDQEGRSVGEWLKSKGARLVSQTGAVPS